MKRRFKVNKRASARRFRRSAQRTKAVNLGRGINRGGYRL